MKILLFSGASLIMWIWCISDYVGLVHVCSVCVCCHNYVRELNNW